MKLVLIIGQLELLATIRVVLIPSGFLDYQSELECLSLYWIHMFRFTLCLDLCVF